MPRDPHELAPTQDLLARFSDWLIRDARFLPGNKEVLEYFCERASAAGIPIDRVSLHQLAFHPQYRGVARVWWSDKPMSELFFDHGIEKTATYLQNPLRPVLEEGQRVEWRLDGNDDELPYPILGELRDQGFTHYAIAPLKYAVGITNAFSWATKRSGGFTADEMRFFHGILDPYAAVAELKALRRFISGMMTTYIGAEAGRLILDGQVQRGDTHGIQAALMLWDLRDFTLMSDRLSPRAVVRMLNQYFDCVIPPVRQHGGEVVEIMGDGVLAIFQHGAGNTAAEACGSALAAATDGLAALDDRNLRHPSTPLRAGVALHYGAVSYGNIGSDNRLDFTVIGPDVNLTSRIERLCRELDRSLIMSEAFADTLHRTMWEIGHFELRGFAKMQRLFELPPV
ncbi:MAG TPA: adenylate/guanylate cyclase domain-containing protein [Stellaceae bacterium]|jgi:adenylate cyclase